MEFIDQCQLYRKGLNQLCTNTSELFLSRNKAFKEASVLFEDGGDYAEKEVNICIASIRDIMYTFEKQVNNHHRDGK